MVPIYDQTGEGIGYNFKDFLKRFIAICEQHKQDGRARSFAFIFYDFHNTALYQALRLKGTFALLDRLSGHDMSIFYLNSKDRELFQHFNAIFLHAFGIEGQYRLPMVVFFDLLDGEADHVTVKELEQEHASFTVMELQAVFEQRLQEMRQPAAVAESGSPLKDMFRKYAKLAGGKVIDALLSKAAEEMLK